MAETSHDRESRSVVLRRRLVTIPRDVGMFILLTLLAPIVAFVALGIDLLRWGTLRRPFMTLRLAAFAWVFLATEVVGLLWMASTWVAAGFGRNRRRLVEPTWRIQQWWATRLFNAVRRIFGLTLAVDGLDAATPGPLIVLFRHTSIIDNLLPTAVLGAETGLRLRWVVKKELLGIPAIDVAGNRLPNHFVDRTATDPRRELRAIRHLGDALGPSDGVLIYPEGTRFTPDRRRRILADMEQSGDAMFQRASGLRHVLPPRIGGSGVLLESGADVLIGVHHGLDGFAKIGAIWSGALVGRTVTLNLRRIDAGEVPQQRRARAAWLYDQWEEMDRWLAGRVASNGEEPHVA